MLGEHVVFVKDCNRSQIIRSFTPVHSTNNSILGKYLPNIQLLISDDTSRTLVVSSQTVYPTVLTEDSSMREILIYETVEAFKFPLEFRFFRI